MTASLSAVTESVSSPYHCRSSNENIRRSVLCPCPSTQAKYPMTYIVVQISFCFPPQDIAIDISDRPPDDHPQGIPYRLIGEACIPGISAITPSNIGSIFEEHLIVKQLNLFQYNAHDMASGAGVYGEDENKFIFYNTIVGRKAKARFKISNTNKVIISLLLH